MKRLKRAGLILSGLTVAFVASAALTTPASAGTLTGLSKATYTLILDRENAGNYVATPAHWRHRRRRARRFRRQFRRDYYGYGRGYGRGYYRRGCHAVTKTDYWYGRKAKIGGTMCYDNYGRGYVVPGSRYVIHYYDHY